MSEEEVVVENEEVAEEDVMEDGSENGEADAEVAESSRKEEEVTQVAQKKQAQQTQKTAAEGSLLDQVMDQTRLKSEDEGYDLAKQGVEAFLKELLEPRHAGEKVDKAQVDAMIEELDLRLGVQMDEILHHPDFQKLESAWGNLDMLVDRTDFKENISIQLMNVSQQDLLEDFEDTPEITKSGLYQHVYTNEYGQFGGEPVGVMLANYEFGPGAQDIKLLQQMASVSSMAHAPFIAGASPGFFNIDTYEELPGLKDLAAIFEGPRYAKWQGFRESEDSRNVGLALPHFLMRPTYGGENPVKSFNYQEETGGLQKNYLWGNAAFALATRVTDSFAKYRWCPNIIGPQSGGAILDLPLHVFEKDGEEFVVGPMDVRLSDRREFELAEEGFIGLSLRKGSDNAAFFSANSVQKAKSFGDTDEGRQAGLNFRLGTQLPYMFIITRLAHYIKVLQRENLGSWKGKNDLERELNQWVNQYISAQENPPAAVRSRRPLRSADIVVSEVPGEAGWFAVEINVTPHMKFMGANFTLSLTGRLDTV